MNSLSRRQFLAGLGATAALAALPVRWVAGNPARKLRDLTEKDFETFRRIAAGYVELARSYETPADAKAAE